MSTSRPRGVLRVDQLTVTYPGPEGRRVSIVRDLSFTVEPGQLVCVQGRSGSGKTSVIRHLAGLAPNVPGRVFWDDVDIASLGPDGLAELRRRTAAYADQGSALIEGLSCLENAVLPALPSGRAAVRRAVETARQALGDLGLEHCLHARPTRLSGGERQRVVLARALTAATPALLVDEPTASLDRRWADHVIATLRQFADAGGSVLAVSHDPGLDDAADHVVTLAEERTTW